MNDDQGMHEDVLTGSADAAPAGTAGTAGTAEDPVGESEQADDDSGRSERRKWSAVTEMLVLFAVALTIALLIKTFVVQPFFIPSGSMENTLLVGDKVLVNKLVYHVRPIERGDVVVFNGTGSWNPPTPAVKDSRNLIVRAYDDTLGALLRSVRDLFAAVPDQVDYIKRVIGVPGDHIVCCNSRGQLLVNGVALSEKSYLYPGSAPSVGKFSVVVPPGRLWVMGDHRDDSADSRFHDCAYKDSGVECLPIDRDGTIPENEVVGRAFMIVWPVSQFRVLPIPATFDQPRLLGTAAGKVGEKSSAVSRSVSYLPLGIGLGSAVPVTLAQRRLRRRVRRRLRVGR